MKGFINVGGTTVAVDQIATLTTQYYNGGQTIVTYIGLKNGHELEVNGTTKQRIIELMEAAEVEA